MRLFTTVAGLRCYLNLATATEQSSGKRRSPAASPQGSATVGLVPTMGALHAGHLSLIQRARQENSVVLVSIFVNPLQFGPHEDFQKYPRTLEKDKQLCEQAGVDVIFAPSAAELYGTADASHADSLGKESLTQVIPPIAMMAGLCGRVRPGHFQGVATVVTKLLNLTQPDRAYFGQKDSQQLAILQKVVADLNLPVEIVSCPTVREPSGLALSSRNQYLSDDQRSQAAIIYSSLKQAEQRFLAGTTASGDLIAIVKQTLATVTSVHLEYVELVHPKTMIPLENVEEVGLLAIAAHVGSTRLIDNILLHNRKPIVAIDGPAGAGKSTVVRRVAQSLELLYLDTGAMYRAVTWLVLQSGIAVDDEPAIAELVSQCEIRLDGGMGYGEHGSGAAFNPQSAIPSVWINGQDITHAVRSPEVTAQVSAIAAQPAVRCALVKQQQDYGRRGGVVMDGRDIGTYVFPDAELKIFLTASVQERARRRLQDLKNQGLPETSLQELEQAIYERDWKDSHRAIAPLKKAHDAIEIQTDGLSIDTVVGQIVTLYHQRLTQQR